jgi:hypothetical protein
MVKNKSGGDAVMPTLAESWLEEAVLAIDDDLVVDVCHRSGGGQMRGNLGSDEGELRHRRGGT